MKVIIFFDRFGPYHISRIEAAASRMQVIGLELCGESVKYAWDRATSKNSFKRITLFPKKTHQEISSKDMNDAFAALFAAEKPDAVAIPGWSYRGALSAISACRKAGIPMIVMSESTALDSSRRGLKEWIKKQLVSLFSAGIVGGKRQKSYLESLGMSESAISLGYNTVDNNHFENRATDARTNERTLRKELNLPENYFFSSSRFIPKKNLPVLLTAFAEYQRQAGANAWKLVLLGDGPLFQEVSDLRDDLGLTESVHLPGFKQYDELPNYFALAEVFLLASTSEQWGLVVNEALACGLPVIVSERCGCSPELVIKGRNGFTFDPEDHRALAALMHRVSGPEFDRKNAGDESRKIVSHYSPEYFAEGMHDAAAVALEQGPPRRQVFTGVILNLLSLGKTYL